MTIAKKIDGFMSSASWIRKMFEEGARLKAEHGAANVFDFSLGNPNLPPPDQFQTGLKQTIESLTPGAHAYMPNTGLPETREAIAGRVAREHGVTISAEEIVMTCGAAGALNVILKSLLDPGDEVITPAPFFVEYRFYADNHGGLLKTVATQQDFSLDLAAIEAAIGPQTKAVLINSPNNPTGQLYSAASLAELAELLRRKSEQTGRTIYLLSDEPYRKIVYGDVFVPSIFTYYADSIVATSFSKDISIPGERLGYIAVNPQAACKADLMAAMTLANRILGFVNAPGLIQRVVANLSNATVDVAAYARKRELLCGALADFGYVFTKPPGAFYLFARTPIADDVAFVKMLQDELILTVPGSGFGGPGHFRISYCVDDDTIVKAMPGFKRAMERCSELT